MKGIVCEGDPTDHGGYVVSTNSTYYINGKKVALLGDMVSCLKDNHGINPIIEADETMMVKASLLMGVVPPVVQV